MLFNQESSRFDCHCSAVDQRGGISPTIAATSHLGKGRFRHPCRSDAAAISMIVSFYVIYPCVVQLLVYPVSFGLFPLRLYVFLWSDHNMIQGVSDAHERLMMPLIFRVKVVDS